MKAPPILLSESAKKEFILYGLKLMLAGAVSWASQVPFGFSQNAITQLLLILGLGGVLMTLVAASLFVWRHWKHFHLFAVAPVALLFLLCPATLAVGRAARWGQFAWRFPHYQALVERVEASQGLASGEVKRVPLSAAERKFCYNVLAQRDTNGVLTVELLTGRGFPVKHSGYLYTSSGSIQSGSFFDTRWHARTELRPKWFRISD